MSPDDPRLVEELLPRADEILAELRTKARFKRLRRALRERLAEEDAGDEGDDEAELAAEVPADWPFWSVTMGKRAAIVGGDLREESRARLERSFRFASLRWVTSDRVRGAQQLAESVRAGGVDVVILLRRFVSHEIEPTVSDACDDARIDCVGVDRGYGVTQIRLAFERALAKRAS